MQSSGRDFELTFNDCSATLVSCFCGMMSLGRLVESILLQCHIRCQPIDYPCDLAVLPINLNGDRVVAYTGEVLQGNLEFQRLTLSNLTRGAPTYWCATEPAGHVPCWHETVPLCWLPLESRVVLTTAVPSLSCALLGGQTTTCMHAQLGLLWGSARSKGSYRMQAS